MRPFPRLLLAAAALGVAVPAFGQALVFKGGERWEVNDPFKVDTSVIPPKPVIDKKKGTISSLKGTVERTTVQDGTELVMTRKLAEVERIIWPLPERLTDAQNNVNRGEPGKALDNIEPIIKFFEPIKKVPGSWWLKASIVKLDALDRLANDAALSSFLDNLEKADDGSIPELATKIKLARLMQRARRGEHEAVIAESTALIPQMDDPDLLARLHLVKGSSLLATKKYEAAMNTFLRVPVFSDPSRSTSPRRCSVPPALSAGWTPRPLASKSSRRSPTATCVTSSPPTRPPRRPKKPRSSSPRRTASKPRKASAKSRMPPSSPKAPPNPPRRRPPPTRATSESLPLP